MNIFIELSVIIVITAAVCGLMKVFRQPIIIGYILTGILLGPELFNLFRSPELLSVFSEMGITILLFIVGLHLNPSEARGLGMRAVIAGLLQVGVTSILGFVLAYSLGYSTVASIYIGIGLAFSSTIIVLKLLSDKKDLETLYGKISIGILLIQDIVAAFCLILVSAFSDGSFSLQNLAVIIGKFILFTLVIIVVSAKGLPKLSEFFAKSQEYLFVFSLAWGFGLAALFSLMGLSVEIGALVAGVSLSFTPYSPEISSRMRPLRDFFILMFFLTLGSKISFANFHIIAVSLVAFVLFVIVVKPLIVFFILMLFKYNKKTGFFGGVSMGQISEFSMILAALGLKLGHINSTVLSLLTMLAVTTIAVSSYMIKYLEKFYPIFSSTLGLFERKRAIQEKSIISTYDVVLFGCNRVGYDFIRTFKKLGSGFLAVDFDPDIIKDLETVGVSCAYGDAEDSEYLEDINIGSARLVVSTIPDYETNIFLLTKIRAENKNSMIILMSYNIDNAIRLYENGATYVILPHFIGGQFAAHLAEEAGFDVLKVSAHRNEHIRYLTERKKLGHAHPIWEHNHGVV